MFSCAFVSGSDEAYVELYTRYSGRMAAYIDKVIAHPDETEDLFQTVWMKLFRMRDQREPIKNFELFLFRIARNECISFLRKRKETPIEEYHDVSTRIELSAAMEQTELKSLLEEALRSLPIVMREAFVLKENNLMSFAEVASITGIAETLARVRYHRAKHLLRKYIVKKLRLTEGEHPAEFI